MSKYKFTEDLILSQVFSFEVLDYFDSIVTDKNFEWIEKYFDILMKDENIDAEKFNMHHIRPCCTFKDKEHKNRKQTQKLGDEFNGNLIKLSIYNHIFAHFYLWKIFNSEDLKESFQRMCGQGKYIDNFTEDELKDVARLKEECTKKNQTKEEKREYQKEWYENNKEQKKEYNKNNKEKIEEYQKQYQKEYRENNKEKESKRQKEYRENNKKKESKRHKIYYKNDKENILKQHKEYREKNKEELSKKAKKYREKNKEELSEKQKIRYHQQCYDPIKKDFCTYRTLISRKSKHKNLYKGVILKDCIIK